MVDKVYYHQIDNENEILLASGTTGVYNIISTGTCLLTITSDGYSIQGSPLPDCIHIYYDSVNSLYHITRTQSNTNRYITVEMVAKGTLSKFINGYGVEIDTTSYTKLNQIGYDVKYDIPIKYDRSTIRKEANSITEYVSILPRRQYAVQSSLVIISLRNINGTGANGVYLLSRNNPDSISTFTLTEISVNGNIQNFNLTPTTNGFTFTNTSNYSYNITEIATSK